jgi:NADPH:quinone reductase-like Zn-dependent oxidoreductase
METTMTTMTHPAVRPFRINVPDEALVDLRRRIAATRWPDKETVSDRSQGAQLEKIQALVRYWGTDYDWRKVEATLNALPQFMTEIDGLDIHFIHVRSPHPHALPLIMTHGWPGSILELLKVIGPLTDPPAYGGRAEDAFHLVLPSMPGYGFSARPTETGWGPDRIGRAWDVLMKRLGYERYVSQGGDWGSVVSDVMARQAPTGLLGIHVNMPATVPPEIAKALQDGDPAPTGLSLQGRTTQRAPQQRECHRMKAIRIHGRGGPDDLVYDEVPKPHPGPGEVLVRVAAAGILVNELKWDETYQTAAGEPRPLPIPGRDLSGVVAEVSAGVAEIAVGDAVYAMLGYGRDGAEAEYALVLPSELAPQPRTLDEVQAAAVPLSALTAWQALFIHAKLSKGQRVLIHGASGGVGTYAVQFAHWAGAQVLATASARNVDFVRDLGADQIIDYATTRFEDVVHDLDVVFDLVGGDTLSRSWPVVREGGVLVSVVSPPPTEPAPRPGVRFVYFIVEPSGEQLRLIGGLLDAGQVRPIVDQVFPLADARQAYDAGRHGHPRGKIVLTIS